MRKWRNWQTRTFEGRVVYTVRVQVPFSAPKNNRWDFPSVIFLRGKQSLHVPPRIARKYGRWQSQRVVSEANVVQRPVFRSTASPFFFGEKCPYPHHKETIILIRKISVLWFFYYKNCGVLPIFIGFIAKTEACWDNFVLASFFVLAVNYKSFTLWGIIQLLYFLK